MNITRFFKQKGLAANILLMFFFGILSLLMGEIKFEIPVLEGGISDLREIVILISCFYLPHWIYLIGISLITSLGTPPDGLFIASIIMHFTGVIFAWHAYYYLKGKSINIYFKGLWWLLIVLLYYALFLIPILVVITHYFGQTRCLGLLDAIADTSWTLRFEIAITGLATLVYFIFVLIEHDLREKVTWLELVIKSANVGFWKGNPAAKDVIYHNQWASMLEYLDGELELAYATWEELLHPYDKDRVAEYIRELQKKQKDYYNLEYRLKSRSGEYKWILDVGKKINTDNQLQYAGISININKRKKTEEELKHAKIKAEESDKLKSEFLAQMSHEIRTPVNTLLSFSELVFSEIGHLIPADLKPALSSIKNSGNRLIRTVDLILNVSEINVGSYSKIEKVVDIYDMLEQVVYEFKHSQKNKNVELILEPGGKESYTLIDNYSTSQIFYNIIENALKYTKKGYVKITLRSDKNTIVVDVEDTGIGISEEYLPRIFNQFEQEAQGYTRPYEGNGLGMSLVKKYCEINDIIISIKSKQGEGTTVSLIIPKRNGIVK